MGTYDSIIPYICECAVLKLFWESFNDWLSNRCHIDNINLIVIWEMYCYECLIRKK